MCRSASTDGRGYPILCDGSTLTAVLISSSVVESLGRTAKIARQRRGDLLPAPLRLAWQRTYQILGDPEYTRMRVFS